MDMPLSLKMFFFLELLLSLCLPVTSEVELVFAYGM